MVDPVTCLTLFRVVVSTDCRTGCRKSTLGQKKDPRFIQLTGEIVVDQELDHDQFREGYRGVSLE